jgi:hypothetical protein
MFRATSFSSSVHQVGHLPQNYTEMHGQQNMKFWHHNFCNIFVTDAHNPPPQMDFFGTVQVVKNSSNCAPSLVDGKYSVIWRWMKSWFEWDSMFDVSHQQCHQIWTYTLNWYRYWLCLVWQLVHVLGRIGPSSGSVQLHKTVVSSAVCSKTVVRLSLYDF